MSRGACERALTAAVITAFAALWLGVFGLGEPPEYRSQYFTSALMVAILTTPWVIAARVLLRAWWRRNAERLEALDGPALLLELAVATLPADRREWGSAMAAELTQVEASERWSFAVGCARAALLPPSSRRGRGAMLLIGTVSAATAGITGPVLGHLLPGLRTFAITFVLLVGAAATLTVARSRRLRVAAAGPVLTVLGLTGVAACIAGTAQALARHPLAATRFPPAAAMFFAFALTGCLWLAIAPPEGLASSRVARGVGAGAAVTLGLGFLVVSRLTIHTLAGPVLWIMFGPAAICFGASALAAALGRSFGAGVQAGTWAALVGTLLVTGGSTSPTSRSGTAT
jgi:hypothetical protein